MCDNDFRSSLLLALSGLQPSTLAVIAEDLSQLHWEAIVQGITDLPDTFNALWSVTHALLARSGASFPSPALAAVGRASMLLVRGYDFGPDTFFSKASDMGKLIAGEDKFRVFEPMSGFNLGGNKKFAVILFPDGVNWPDFTCDDSDTPMADIALWADILDWHILA